MPVDQLLLFNNYEFLKMSLNSCLCLFMSTNFCLRLWMPKNTCPYLGMTISAEKYLWMPSCDYESLNCPRIPRNFPKGNLAEKVPVP